MRRPDRPGERVGTPAPRDVAGYRQARADGLIPVVSSTPPVVSTRPTAARARRDVAVVAGLAVAALAVALAGGGRSAQLSWAALGLVLGVATVGVGALALAVRRWGRAQVAELQRGYTTATFTMGRFWMATTPGGPATNGWVQWDWEATWVLRPDGTVVSAPSGAGDPPGLYPSPRRDGDFELWTGCQWSGYVRQVPFRPGTRR